MLRSFSSNVILVAVVPLCSGATVIAPQVDFEVHSQIAKARALFTCPCQAVFSAFNSQGFDQRLKIDVMAASLLSHWQCQYRNAPHAFPVSYRGSRSGRPFRLGNGPRPPYTGFRFCPVGLCATLVVDCSVRD